MHAGQQLTRDPDLAITSLLKRDANANPDIERERFTGTLSGDVGVGSAPMLPGDVSDARFARAIALVASTNKRVRAPQRLKYSPGRFCHPNRCAAPGAVLQTSATTRLAPGARKYGTDRVISVTETRSGPPVVFRSFAQATFP